MQSQLRVLPAVQPGLRRQHLHPQPVAEAGSPQRRRSFPPSGEPGPLPHKQLVFVGFGEPTYRFDDICWVIDQMKSTAPRSSPGWTPTAPVPSSTAGTSPRVRRPVRYGVCVANTDTAEKYNGLCHPQQQENAYQAKNNSQWLEGGPEVRCHRNMTVWDTIPKEETINRRKIQGER